MAPKDKASATKAPKLDPEAVERYEQLRKFVSTTASVQFCYVMFRTFWHLGLPWLFGVQQFVPLVAELCVAELLVVALFWAAGGFGPAARERGWLLNAYNLLALVVLAKCITDVFIYNFAPHQWAHFRPGMMWGVPRLLAANVPQSWIQAGVKPAVVLKAADAFEKMVDIICLMGCFRGVRAGKAAMLERRAQNRTLQQKKQD